MNAEEVLAMNGSDRARDGANGSPEQTITSQVIARVRNIDHRRDDVVTSALHCILDTLGVAIGGVHEPVTRHVRGEALDEGGAPRATLWGTGERVSRPQAALVNGTAAHALDFDDVSALMEGHPSAPLLPALLAVADGAGTSGEELIAAFVAGFETEAMVGRLMSPSHYARGFHATATVGTFGAAAAGAHVLGLDQRAWAHAFGIAGSRAAGLKSMFGTMSKPLQVGMAAENGLRAATLAARGVTAHPDVLGTAQGFRDTQSDAGGTAPAWDWTGLAITDVLFKYHAACYLTHSAIEGGLSMRDAGVTPERIESVEVLVPAGHLRVCDIAEPSTPLEGKFSLRFTTAMALVTGDLSEQAFTPASLADPRVVALRDRVRVSARTDSDSRSSIVRVTCTDGTERVAEVDVNRPTPASQLDRRWEALVAKFHSLVDPVMSADAADRIVSEVAGLATAESVEPLLRALAVNAEDVPGR
ncbi:MmgE/PrpD family protein [Streptomyces sp. NTH33]|uniref:MmgE/PrpD family protein n=1 Tax=Streptomyces sp. NTH33 TaxID=1735453 RepID=UPI000DAA0FF2|nr:MmgE/PrpD family protein [Streptomyces sp. NTH33]PZH16097.1 MmgE/PrpD family protein [Streptomyces sp. NTH33]